jgi:hypothetical protein
MNTRRFSDQKIADALIATCGKVYLAAERLRCSPRTIYRRAKALPRLGEIIESSRGRLLDAAESALFRAVLDGKSWAVRLALGSLGRWRGYGEAPDAPPNELFELDDPQRDENGLDGSGLMRVPAWVLPHLRRGEKLPTARDIVRALSENPDFVEFCRNRAARLAEGK